MRSIHSLEDLRQAKRELASRKEITKKEFGHHINAFRDDASSYVIKKVLLPLGIGAISALAIKFFFFSDNKKRKDEVEAGEQNAEATQTVKQDVEKNKWLSYLNVVLSFLKIYQTAAGTFNFSFGKQDDEETEDAIGEEKKVIEQRNEEAFSPQSFVRNYREKKGRHAVNVNQEENI